MNANSRLKTYYRLTKPGIVYGNGLAALAGYFFGAMGSPTLTTFVSTLAGISLVIASACVFNNILDKGIDARMARTRQRAIVTGQVPTMHAMAYAAGLLLIGSWILAVGTNMLTLYVAWFGHVAYVVLYGYAKRKTVHGTLVGTISGSTPPVIGYVAATGQLDVVAGILFLILVAWQMPHFYAIALFRRDDYQAAGIPVLPLVHGDAATRWQIVAYVGLFILACTALGAIGASSLFTTLILVLVGLYWLYLCLQPVNAAEIHSWARTQFVWSLKVLLIVCAVLSIDFIFH